LVYRNTMISCDLKGELGNQFFQIVATIAYCVQHKLPFIFPYSEMLNEQPTYWNTMFNSIKQYTSSPANFKNSDEIRDILYQHPKYEEPSFGYVEIPKYNDIMLCGYFQSYKYFENIQSRIPDIFDIKFKQIQIRTEFAELLNSPNLVSLHFMRGDLPVDYYSNALKKLDKPGKVLVFGEKEELQNINTNTFVMVDSSIPDWKQMLIMSCCDVNIIANSTFSWWGAYLNQKKDKIVFYPESSMNIDMFPSEWIQVSCQKIDC
jgi:hypothetical protein